MKCIEVKGGYDDGQFVLARVTNIINDGMHSTDEWNTITNIIRLRNASNATLIWDYGKWDVNTWG